MRVSDDIPASVRQELTRRGHHVETTQGPIAHPIMISIDVETGMLQAAGDPRAGRHAAALK